MNESIKRQQRYCICIEEVISQEFEIEAGSVEEALEKARSDYRDGELVLDEAHLSHVQMRCLAPNTFDAGADDEWEEL